MSEVKQLAINQNQEEQLGSEESSLFKFDLDSPDSYINRTIPWHWHSFLEFNYVVEGSMEIHATNGMRVYEAGEMAFFNSNVMHRMQSADSGSSCKFYAFLFPQSFLSGGLGSMVARKYFAPVTQSSELAVYPITPDSDAGSRMLEEFMHIVKLRDEMKFGYEFEVQHHLAKLWLLLFEDTKIKGLHGKEHERSSIHEERVKEMLLYIHENYSGKIEIQDICSAVGIGRRECFRCFETVLSTSPVEYINEYRVGRAADMLLHTSKPITEIAFDCGFESGSYFTRTFNKYTGTSPRAYRSSH